MKALEKEERRLLGLLVQNLEAQLMPNPTYQKLMETKALFAGLKSNSIEGVREIVEVTDAEAPRQELQEWEF